MAFCLGRIYALSMFYNLNDISSPACGSNDVGIGETSNTINTVDVCESLHAILDFNTEV